MKSDPPTITAVNWAKAIENRSASQCTAHLYITFNNIKEANRAIIDRLNICNKKCKAEKSKKEPTKCLKCQGWNHIAKDCKELLDTCGNCAGKH